MTPSTSPILALLAFAAATIAQAAEPSFETRVREFALDRYHDGRLLIEGPHPLPTPAIDASLDCTAIYERRVALRRARDDHNVDYWDDPRNQAAVFLGAIWTPAFYFLGYSALDAHLEDLRLDDPLVEIDALSRLSAQKRCFER